MKVALLIAASLSMVAANAHAALPNLAPFLAPIIGGSEVAANDPIAQTTVAVYNAGNGGLCTGSIIDQDLIVTAAHCVSLEDPSGQNIFLIFARSVADMTEQNVFTVMGQQVPSAWNPDSETKDAHDIALLRLKGQLPTGYHPAKRLGLNDLPENGEMVALAGYGIRKATGEQGAGETSGTLYKTTVKVADANFGTTEVLLDQTQGTGACHGDSGGPAFTTTASGELRLWGVTNRAFPDDAPDDCAHQSVYTNINAHNTWLEQAAATLQAIQ